MPDTALLLALCQCLGININDLLSGEVVSMDNYQEKLEQNLLEVIRQKTLADKQLLRLEWLIGLFSCVIFFGLLLPAVYVPMPVWCSILLGVTGFILFVVGMSFGLKIEQMAGYYHCRKCGNKYVPGYGSVYIAPHFGRTRYMKCPCCGKWSYHKKVLEKD